MGQNKFHLLFVVALSMLVFSACNNDSDDQEQEKQSPTPLYSEYIDADTEEILTKLQFIVHKGDTPPSVTGKYHSSHIIVPKSTIPNDGLLYKKKVGEMTYDFFNQRANRTISSKLELEYTYTSDARSEEYDGEGTLITGSGNDFTVYSIYDGVLHTDAGDAKGKLLYLISATIVKDENGNSKALKDVSSILLMLDDYGDPLGTLIPNGSARKFVSSIDATKID